MAIIKDIEQLKPLITTAKTVQKISEFSEKDSDSWSKVERIIVGIDHLLDTAIKMKQADSPLTNTSGFPRAVMTDTPNATLNNTVKANPAEHANNAENEGEKGMKVNKQMIKFFSDHVNACVKENPNMTLGECLAKLPVNVTQLSVLLQFAEKGVK